MAYDFKLLAQRFLTWPLPNSVASDFCVTNRTYPFPRLPALFNHAMFAFTDQAAVVSYLAQSKNDRPSLLRKHERVAMKYKFSLVSLIRTLIDENRDLKKQLKEAQAYNDATRSNY